MINEQIDDAVKFSLNVAGKILANKKEFMLNVLSMIIWMISGERSPKEAEEWFDAVIEKSYDVADEISANKIRFMLNILSGIVFMISQRRSPEEAKDWFDAVIKEVRKLKKNCEWFEAAFWYFLIFNVCGVKNINAYLWLKFAILNGIEEIEKNYEALPKDAPLRIANVCTNLIIAGKDKRSRCEGFGEIVP